MEKIAQYTGGFIGVVKIIAVSAVLVSAVMFTSAAQAASETISTSLIPTTAVTVNKPIQVAYWHRYHRHGWYHGRWHRGHGRYYRYWYRY